MTDLKQEIEDILHPERVVQRGGNAPEESIAGETVDVGSIPTPLINLHPPMAPKEYHTHSMGGETSPNLNLQRAMAGEKEKELNADVKQVQSGVSEGIDFAHSKLAILTWREAKEWLLTNSSMDRVLMEFVKKIVPGFENVKPRLSMSKAQTTVRQTQKKIKQNLDLVELLRKEKAPFYRECMKELKEVLANRNKD